MPKFKIVTLGCKVNLSESDVISSRFEANGWLPVQSDEPSDLCIVNTCAVTLRASQQSRQAVRGAIRSNPDALVLVTGCDAQVEPEAFREIPGVHEIISQKEKLDIPGRFPVQHLAESGDGRHRLDTLHYCSFASAIKRTRPFLKIQDGCDAFCTYCIVPYARGPSRSMPSEQVLLNIRQLKDAGFREVVLSGIHLGSYGLDLRSENTRLVDLLKRIDADGVIDRVRLSSIEPLELSEDIIRLVAASSCICHHFHIPLQSGDDGILKRMNRPYSISHFKELVLKIHKWIPDAAIGVDVMIGFPGETDTAFENTYKLIEQLPISYLHVFPFSSRKGTAASRFPEHVESRIKKIRCQHMRSLGIRKKKVFYERFIGARLPVLIEETEDPQSGSLRGKTSNYLTIKVKGPDELKNQIVSVRLVEMNGIDSVRGEIF
ncbi:MAG: tRNA (N(6)-L-threonylcarbamoyladenosine(37)-C(2))-methylthiotransferase MtaB [Deltaproteobacteria bacterium]|nr:tRNA (N(6)-L-threonylcarbamoyladenosine(37)-C(2))-methylthiotransferase MtaB [Deltaproteobacteria bacterium]